MTDDTYSLGEGRLLRSSPDEVFELTPEERERLDRAPWAGAPPEAWAVFARAMQERIRTAYTDGETTLERALELTWSCAIGCDQGERVRLLALTAREALLDPPPPGPRARRSDKHPKWVRRSAATLVHMLRESRPGEPFAPNEDNDRTTPILEQALEWLIALRLCERVRADTLYNWYREFHPQD